MPWAVVGAVAGAGIAAEAQGDAADEQEDAIQEANQTQQRQQRQTRADTQAARRLGDDAIGQLRDLMGMHAPWDESAQQELAALSAQEQDLRARESSLRQYENIPGYYQAQADLSGARDQLNRLSSLREAKKYSQQGGGVTNSFTTTPGYQFRMDQGIQALDRSAAARGRLNSGGQQQALMRFGQGVASEEYGNQFNRLASLAGFGQAATQNTASLGAQMAASTGANQIAAGQARAQGHLGQANAINSGLGGLAYTAGNNGWGGGLFVGQSGFDPNSSYNYANPQYSPL